MAQRSRSDAGLAELARTALAAVGELVRALVDEEEFPPPPPPPLPGDIPEPDFPVPPTQPVSAEGLLSSVTVISRPLRVELMLKADLTDSTSSSEPTESKDWCFTLDEHLSAQMLLLAHARDALIHDKRVRLSGTKRTLPLDAPARLEEITLLSE